jgi:hypothetical protein
MRSFRNGQSAFAEIEVISKMGSVRVSRGKGCRPKTFPPDRPFRLVGAGFCIATQHRWGEGKGEGDLALELEVDHSDKEQTLSSINKKMLK